MYTRLENNINSIALNASSIDFAKRFASRVIEKNFSMITASACTYNNS